MLHINGADPLYLQLYHHIRADIECGKLAKGQKIKSERKLAAEYGISRVTARMALQCLEENGFITIEPNKGACVL